MANIRRLSCGTNVDVYVLTGVNIAGTCRLLDDNNFGTTGFVEIDGRFTSVDFRVPAQWQHSSLWHQ